MLQFKGKVAYQELEMGFWGIIAEDGTAYLPQNLDAKFQKEGLQVEVKAKEASMMGILMWGTAIEIVECKVI